MRTKKRETLPIAGGSERGAATREAPVALRIVGTGRDVPLPADLDAFGIGSDVTNHLILDDRYVSAFHCLLERKGKRVLLRDRQSRNGTFVNGARVHESDVDVGARIRVGGTTLALVGSRPERPCTALDALVGEDAAFRRAVLLALRAAPTTTDVLFVGESGSGKELVARLVHEASARTAGPFVALNCGAIARDLIESELFGHERGAFTGAHERRLGVFEQAQGGTLFLDEIGELPREQQPRLLRVLEMRRVRRIGGEGEREVDVRVVSATHRDLRAAATKGEFRLDLFHRLCSLEIRLPALRERPGDIPLLVQTFLAEAEREHGPLTIGDATLAALSGYAWPGNVRELRNAVRRAALLGGGELRLCDLLPPSTPEAIRAIAHESGAGASLRMEDMTRALMEHALLRHGSYRRAAASLGMSKSSFHDRARRFGLAPPRVTSVK